MGIEKSIDSESAQNHSVLNNVKNWRRLLVLFLVLSPGMDSKGDSINHNIGKDDCAADSHSVCIKKCEDEQPIGYNIPRYPGFDFMVF